MPSFSLLPTLAVIALHTTLASARPVDNSANAYSGKGGHASGGNVTVAEKEKTMLSALGLDNAGHGGAASSGAAVGGGGSDWRDGHGDKNHGDHKDHHLDDKYQDDKYRDDNYRDDDHKDDYEDEDYEDHLDGKRHEYRRKDGDCDC
ncbi:hypothetical protein C0995_011288 [Termitomyces sp. Mi166|nr:hypothetical protein C0995_011288 [Termitomyces sp. Mi166\